ncbi:DNA repair protein RAD51 homolog 3 [Scaptodrosophila lebanonensis]|uniref:DNA repair protein RAD51 homolog 3 n=1 Tax=Drosophila lebanonensis TaxID=7225 RepID=A0A6J2TA11_DROLE|nr:DNA repair protein RAD51 homolog 3 [Scaptodrosophila lebanonensis]
MYESCLDTFNNESANQKITTGIKELDDYLHGGIALRKITEFVSKSGNGKTQMCLQLSLNVQRPKSLGGLEGKALYIDTRQDFNPLRLKELATHLESRWGKVIPELNATKMVQNVNYVCCPNVPKLIANILSLDRFLSEQPDIKLIVIDSLSFSLRMIEEIAERNSVLFELHNNMRRLLRNNDVALVVTNELTHRLVRNRFTISPALGDFHGHLLNERIWFSRAQNSCHGILVGKTLQSHKLIGLFKIKHDGINNAIDRTHGNHKAAKRTKMSL